MISASALLAATPAPTREEIRGALAGNLCRCGAYPKIERAVLRASGQEVS
jgi:aerobic-type carbon monoxide dehydrogenase small subunit (CoxS/CutS family)